MRIDGAFNMVQRYWQVRDFTFQYVPASKRYNHNATRTFGVGIVNFIGSFIQLFVFYGNHRMQTVRRQGNRVRTNTEFICFYSFVGC
ncbi:hypothetical protein D3C74_431390 [compost metagenome]